MAKEKQALLREIVNAITTRLKVDPARLRGLDKLTIDELTLLRDALSPK